MACPILPRAGSKVFLEAQDGGAAAWALLKARQDKEWSLVDAAGFVVMQTYGMRDALTTDHHFEQAQFTRLPARP